MADRTEVIITSRPIVLNLVLNKIYFLLSNKKIYELVKNLNIAVVV